MDEELIRLKVKCCCCEGSLKSSKRINLVGLMKEAQWAFPVWGNLLLGIMGFANAVICDKCLKEKKKPKFAVEWTEDLNVVKYHSVEELRDVPKEIFKQLDQLEHGRRRVAG